MYGFDTHWRYRCTLGYHRTPNTCQPEPPWRSCDARASGVKPAFASRPGHGAALCLEQIARPLHTPASAPAGSTCLTAPGRRQRQLRRATGLASPSRAPGPLHAPMHLRPQRQDGAVVTLPRRRGDGGGRRGALAGTPLASGVKTDSGARRAGQSGTRSDGAVSLPSAVLSGTRLSAAAPPGPTYYDVSSSHKLEPGLD